MSKEDEVYAELLDAMRRAEIAKKSEKTSIIKAKNPIDFDKKLADPNYKFKAEDFEIKKVIRPNGNGYYELLHPITKSHLATFAYNPYDIPVMGSIESPSLSKKISDLEAKDIHLDYTPQSKNLILMDYPFIENENLRGRGIGREIYSLIEKDTGKKIVPDTDLSSHAASLHKKYGLGKKFGSAKYEPEIVSSIESSLKKASDELSESEIEKLSDSEIKQAASERYKALKEYMKKLLPEFGFVSKTALPALGTGALIAGKALGKAVPLVGSYWDYQDAKEAGMTLPQRVAYVAGEQANPLPISGLDIKAGLEGLGGLIRDAIYTGDKDSMFPSPEAEGERIGLENYKKAKLEREKEAARQKEMNKPNLAFSKLRGVLNNNLV